MTSGSRYHFVQSQESEFRIAAFLDKVGARQKTSIGRQTTPPINQQPQTKLK